MPRSKTRLTLAIAKRRNTSRKFLEDIQASITSSSSSQPTPHTWLQLLPTEVLAKVLIQVHLSTFPHQRLLQLSSISANFTNAIDLAHSFFPPQPELLFTSDTITFRLSDFSRASIGAAPFEHIPGTQSLIVSNRPVDYTSIPPNIPIASLSIIFTTRCSTRRLQDSIRRFSLRSLALVCPLQRGIAPRRCVFHDFFTSQHIWRSLAESCPVLKTLHVDCRCKHQQVSTDISVFLETSRSVRTLIAAFPFSAALIPHLRALDSVGLSEIRLEGRYNGRMEALAEAIGDAVTSIEHEQAKTNWFFTDHGPYVTAERLARLAACPRLKKLTMLLGTKAEGALPALRELTTLNLSWVQCWGAYMDLNPDFRPCFYEPPSSFFQHLITEMVHLRQLYLFRIQIATSQVRSILQAFGSQLIAFGTSIVRQEEQPETRLENIMDFVGKYCREIRELEFCRSELPAVARRYPNLLAWRKRVVVSAALLRRRAPQWNFFEFRRFASFCWFWSLPKVAVPETCSQSWKDICVGF